MRKKIFGSTVFPQNCSQNTFFRIGLKLSNIVSWAKGTPHCGFGRKGGKGHGNSPKTVLSLISFELCIRKSGIKGPTIKICLVWGHAYAKKEAQKGPKTFFLINSKLSWGDL